MRALSWILSAIALLTMMPPVAAHAQSRRPTQAEVISSCESCHGLGGRTQSAAVPRLNGQTREYLVARLKDLRIGTNQTASAIHAMLGPARGVSDADLNVLADHFASQPATVPAPGGRGREAGAQLYARGDGARLPSCASCHGDSGQGIGGAPRLAGQHASYLIDQMEALMLTARIQSGMNRHARLLTAAEIRNLAAFLAND
ncbi:MAG TPA: c-type cytochrome [Rhizomicrobium sp.]|nr:c-type cytochrome [Rhizomicrobium sp.]